MSKFIYKNPNHRKKITGDCVIRALAIALNKSWEDVYLDLSIEGLFMGDILSENSVWGGYLERIGFNKYVCKANCTTVRNFLNTNNVGTYILATGTHVVCGINGNYYDIWDSGDEIVTYYFERRE